MHEHEHAGLGQANGPEPGFLSNLLLCTPMLSFFLIATAIWGAAHVYVALRLVRPLRLRRFWAVVFYLAVVFSALTAPSLFALDVWPAEGALRALTRGFAWLCMGSFSVLFAFVLVRDLTLWVTLLVLERRRHALGDGAAASEDRRLFLVRATGAGAASLTGVLSAAGLAEARTPAEVVEVEVPIEGLPEALDGYHIVQISDVHVGETIDADFIVPVIEQVGALGADLVAVTGDMVDGSVEALRRDVAPLSYLRARDGVFFVTGNHEYYSGVEPWCEHFASLGMVVLNNAHQVVERDGARLLVGGVTDYREGARSGGHPSDPHAALEGAPEDVDFKLLLAHQPRSAYEAARAGFQLQLSGHTHGGQFFPWNLLVGLVQPVAKGLAQIDDMWVYVNRGTCYWGPPLRTGVPAEITSLRLKRV